MNYKNLKYLIIVLIIASGVAGAFYSTKLSDERTVVSKEVKMQTTYYVPVTRYFSETNNVTKEDFIKLASSSDLYFESSEKDNILKLLGKGFEEVPGIDISEINSTLKEDKVAIVNWGSANSGIKTLSYKGDYLWDINNIATYGLKIETEVENSDLVNEEFDQNKITEMVFAGDVMLSRTVATKMRLLGDLVPWEGVASFLKNADVTFLNLEVPLSDLRPVPTSGMSFIAPTKYAEGLTYSGVDVVSVANNHSANFGRAIFEDNLKTLASNNVDACGGGLNDIKSHEVNVIEQNGIKFGFLCYNSVVGGLASDKDSSGVATIKIEPWYRDSEVDIKKAEEDIKKAKKQVDVLIVSPHWGVEYKHYPNDSQQKVAKRMIDAGADLIVGTHPHVVQGSEYYKGKYITYSLGNFIFDQEWSLATKQGTVLRTYFYDNRQLSAELLPIQIENYHKPDFLTGNERQSVLDTIFEESTNLY